MTSKKSIVFCVSFIIAFFAEIALNVACGPEQDPYDYYVSYFPGNVQGDEYAPFGFNGMIYLYSENEFRNESQVNSEEWAKYLNVKKEDVFTAMYSVDSAASARLANFQHITDLPDSLKENTFLKSLTKNKAALKYFVFAKSCEPYAIDNYDSWNPAVGDSSMMSRKAAQGIDLTLAESNQFLKLRYAYQAVRMYRYAANYDDCKKAYNKFVRPSKVKSAVKGWALALYASAVRFTGNSEESAYLFSKVFASNPERRVQAYRNYFYNTANIANVLKYAKEDSEKANVWAINSFRNGDLDLKDLEKVYKYDPSSLLNGSLLVREVNKLEQNLIKKEKIALNYFDSYVSRYGEDYYRVNKDSLKTINLKHLALVKKFALKLANEKVYPQPELGTLTAAYLSWIEKKDEQALGYLKRLNPYKLPERLRDQYRITELLIQANKIKKGATFNSNNLVPSLKWLDEKRYAENKILPEDRNYFDNNWGQEGYRFTKTTRNFYQQVLAPAYMKLGDTARAAMAMLKGDLKYRNVKVGSLDNLMSYQSSSFWHKYLGVKTMRALANFKVRPKANNFDGLLSRGLSKLNNDEFYELYGTAYLRKHQYASAINCFNKISANYSDFKSTEQSDNKRQHIDPFVERIRDYPKDVEKTVNLNKKTFAKKMLRLQKLIISDKKNASFYYYSMANAVYQTGEFGDTWFFISYDWNSDYANDKPVYSYDSDFKLAQTAKVWYLKARLLSRDANFKAKCTFMLAKCEQKKRIGQNFATKDNDISNYINNPYFHELKSKYSKVPFYKIAVNECSYFRDFLYGL